MADNVSLLRFENTFLAIEIYVVTSILDGLDFMFGKMFQQGGAVNRFIYVSILGQQYFWWRFYPAFSNTLGFYSARFPFRFSDSS